MQEELFPHLPRATVESEARHLWNEFKKAQEEFGGLIPGPLVCHALGISRARLHQLVQADKIRTFTVLGVTSYSAEDVKVRLAAKAAGDLRGGRPANLAQAA